MNKIVKYMSIATMALAATACEDYLDKEVDLSLSAENIFAKAENTKGFLANIYTYLPDEFQGFTDGQFRGASRDCMTDNAISFWNVHYYHSIQSDAYTAENHWFANDYWVRNYKGIRACNQFLTYVREDVVGNTEKKGDNNRLCDRYKAEARFMRALYHFELISWFGGVPIIGDDEDGKPLLVDGSTVSKLDQVRPSLADAFQWVADECDAIKDALPFRYADEDENWGRVNGAAAYMLRSRALLYKASPLANTGNDKGWWSEAAQAARDFIAKNAQQNKPYALFTTEDNDPSKNYYKCFIETPHINNEYILSRSEWSTRAIEEFLAPCGFSGLANSTGRTNPTQNLVDSYETIKGLPINEDASYDPQKPYANRDPRLEQTILHHGSIWGDATQGEEREVDVLYGTGKDYKALHGGTTTGYYTKKYLNNMSFKVPANYTHACPIFRYAEVLLNAAEAVNEAEGPDKAYEYVNEVRARVGMPAYKGMTQERLRERIHNERRIELCFENHRFFDVRRWKLYDGVTAASEKSKPTYQQVVNLYGTRVTEGPVFTQVEADLHPTIAFQTPKNYFFPIPNKEIKKLNNVKQNPGWEL